MNAPLNRAQLKQLLSECKAPCISLYQPTHRSIPERQQDQIRFKNLLRQLHERVRQQTPEQADELLHPLQALLDEPEFWEHASDGIAVFSAPGTFRAYHLQHPVAEHATVDRHPHLRPLLQFAQSVQRFQILCLSRDSIRLFEGNREALDELPLATPVPRTLEQVLGSELTEKGQSGFPQGFGRAGERGDSMQVESGGRGKQDEIDRDRDRYFRAVDQAILDQHSHPAELPLILAALPEHRTHFRRISRNPMLMDESIDCDPSALSPDELRDKAWQAMQPRYLERLAHLLDRYGEAQAQGLASDKLEAIAQAIVANRVATLLVEAERDIRGYIERDCGQVQVATETQDAPDLLDDLSAWVLEFGGEVLVMPREQMPSKSGAAAIYRF
nr:hypothetical protein [uncultured Pseudomonas sp.]